MPVVEALDVLEELVLYVVNVNGHVIEHHGFYTATSDASGALRRTPTAWRTRRRVPREPQPAAGRNLNSRSRRRRDQ
jgi:hypothetical protein